MAWRPGRRTSAEVAGSSRCKGGCGGELCCADEMVGGAIVAAQHKTAAVNAPAKQQNDDAILVP